MKVRMLKSNILIACCAALLFAGCSEGNKSQKAWRADQTVSALAGKGTKKEMAEAYVGKAALLMNAVTMPQAVRLIRKARSYDPKNERALFLEALLRPISDTEGLLAEIEKKRDSKKLGPDYRAFTQRVKKNPLYRDFLYSRNVAHKIPSGENYSERQILGQIDQFRESAMKSYKQLRHLRGKSFKFEFLVPSESAPIETLWQECPFEVEGEDVLLSQCPYLKPFTVELEPADVEVVGSIFAAKVITQTIFSSYEMDGWSEINRISMKHDLSQEAVFKFLEAQKNFGKRRGQGFSLIKNLGVDVIAGMKWMVKMQASLCPVGHTEAEQRQGRLFSTGICLAGENQSITSTEYVLGQMEDAFNGKLMRVGLERDGDVLFEGLDQSSGDYHTVVNVGQFLTHSPENLKDLFPASYDEEGKIMTFKDPTLGGLFPAGDANGMIQVMKNAGEKERYNTFSDNDENWQY
jgi:hypothetical protein